MARTSPVHYIAPSSISITPNANGLASDLAVYIEPGTKIRVFEPTIAALGMQDSNFQEWTLEGRNRRLNDATKPYTVYARLNKSNTADGYLVFAPQVQDENEEWQDPYVLSPNTSASSAMTETVGGKAYTWDALPAKQAQGGRSGYWWIKLGTISAPVSSVRAITLDTGILGTDGYNADWALNPVLYPSRVVTVDRGLWSATPQAVFSAEGFDHAEWTPDGKLATVNGRSYGTLVASYGEQGVKQVVSTGDTISEPYHFKTMSKATWLNRRLSTPQTGADGVNDGMLEARCLTEFMEDLEISRVWHYGCLWECLADGTTEEPGYGCTDWQVISGDTSFHLYITGENGATLGDTLTVNRGSVNETLRGSLFRGQEDVSAKVSAWSWDIIEAGGQVISGTSSQRQLVVTDGSLPASWTANGFVTLRLNAVLDGVTFTVYLKIVNTDISSYEVEFSGYVDVITVDDVGNCIGGLYTVSSDSSSSDDGETYRDYRIHSAISVRRNGALLICEDSNLSPDSSDSSSSSSSDDDVPAGAGRYKIYAEPHGCTCVIENSTIYITSIDNIKDGVAGSQDDVNFDYDAMRQMEQCSVDLLIDCEGIATIQKNFPVTIKHDSQPFVGADISNEHSAVSWITRTRQYIGLPVVMDFKMWHNNEVLDVATLSLASATTGVSLVEGTAPSTLASKTIYYTKSRITAYKSGVSYKFYRIELTAMSHDIPLVVDIDVTGTALYSGVSYERTLRHTVSKSTDTNVYSLIPSTDEVIVAKTGVLSTNTITCGVMCDSSDDTHYIVDPANYSTHKLAIYYKKFYTDGTADANETAYTNSGVGVTSAVREVVFYLYGTTNGSVDRTIFHDSEGVPVIANGTDGNGVEYIFMQMESWSGNDNDKPTIYDDSEDTTVVSGSTTRADLFQQDDHCPYDTAAHYGNQNYQWTDEPQGVAANMRFEFYAQRKFKNGRWQPFGDVLLWNHYATSGETMYVIDLSNENSFVNCDEDGTPLTGANYETSEVMIFFGLQSVLSDFNLKVNPVNISCNGYYPRGGTAVSGQQETPDNGGFTLGSPYILTPSNITANAATIAVTATHKTDSSIVLVATYKINKNIAGKTGLIYSLQPSLNVIKKSSTGSFIDQTLGVEVKKTRGVDSTLLTTPKQIADEGLTLLYDNAAGSNNSLVAAGATSTSPVTIATNTFVGSSGTYGKLVLKKGTTVHDTERINCVMDGKSQPFYIQAQEAWSDLTATPLTDVSTWYDSTPAKTKAYLWRRTRKMVLKSDGSAYEVAASPDGDWVYQMLSGTNGTEIKIKGTVANVAALGNISNPADGDTYKCEADGHLYMWSDESNDWVDLGQFKGDQGATYYTHIAWADVVSGVFSGTVPAGQISTPNAGSVTHFSVSPQDGYDYMGVLINQSSGTDATDKLLYTWKYVKGEDGEDAADREWIYRRTDSNMAPSIPTASSSSSDDVVPNDWTDNPQGVDGNNKYEWACYRDKARGASIWSVFKGRKGTGDTTGNDPDTPILWSHYGEQGRDGDGMEYVFIRTNSETAPAIINNNTWQEEVSGVMVTHTVTDDDFLPMTSAGRATDDAAGVDENHRYEWVALRTKTLQADGKTRVWGGYKLASMKLWAKWSEDGEDGKDGVSVESYIETQEAWSSAKEVANAFTEPTPNGGWYGYTPTNSNNNYIYLWRRSRKMVLNAAGTAYEAEQSGGQLTDNGKWKYQRLSGTNGTSIDPKGAVATTSQLGDGYVYPFINGATSQTQVQVSDGWTYVCNADGHLYMWSDELRTKSGSWTDYTSGWLDLGQFKGDEGTTYFTHIAWTDTVTKGTYTGPIPAGQVTTPNAAGSTEAAAKANVGTHTVGNETEVHFSESPQDGYDWMGVLINTSGNALDANSRHLFTWKYVKGADGTSPWLADLDNEMDGIRTTDAGVPTSSQSVQAVPSLYHGATAQTLAITGVKRNGTPMTVVTAGSKWSATGIAVTFNNGVITIAYATTAVISGGKDEFTITIALSTDNTVSFDKTLTVLAMSGDVVNLKPSVSQIKVGRDSSGNYSPSAATINCGYVKKNIEGGITSVDDATAQIDSTYNIYYRLRTRSTQALDTGYKLYSNNQNNQNYTDLTSTGFSVTTYDAIEFILCKNTGSTIASDQYISGLIDRETVPVVADGNDGEDGQDGQPGQDGKDGEDGADGQSSFKSTIFTRTNSTPDAPADSSSQPYGSFAVPSPPTDSSWAVRVSGSALPGVYWHDAIPDGEETLWATTRTFTSDGQSPQDAAWSTPRKMTDTETYDVEFAKMQANDATPATPTDSNRHGGSGTQVWFDPVLDSSENFTQMYWRAERTKKNGTWGSWTIVRIKGEQGPQGQASVMYWIEANPSLVHYNPNTDTCSPANIGLKVHRVEGETDTVLAWADMSTYGLTLQQSTNGGNWGNVAEGDFKAYYNGTVQAATWAIDGYEIRNFQLIDSTTSAVYATAAIGVASDGEDGSNGTNGQDGEDGEDGAPGATGRMFRFRGKYVSGTEYIANDSFVDVVFFDDGYHSETGKYGQYFYINYGSASTNKSGSTYYAPANADRLGNSYNYTSGIWVAAADFGLIITDGIFADFAKLGSAIMSGDYMFSMNGYVNGVAKNNGAMMGTTPAYTRFMGDPTKLGGTFTRTYSGGSPVSGDKDTLAAKVVQKGVTISVTVTGKTTSGTLYIEILNSSGSRLTYTSFGTTEQTQTISYEAPADGTYYVKAYCDAGNRSASFSGTYSFSGYFEPNWWVDLKSGKMSAAKGNFVVDPNGDVYVNGNGDFSGTIRATNLFHNVCMFAEGGIYSNDWYYVDQVTEAVQENCPGAQVGDYVQAISAWTGLLHCTYDADIIRMVPKSTNWSTTTGVLLPDPADFKGKIVEVQAFAYGSTAADCYVKCVVSRGSGQLSHGITYHSTNGFQLADQTTEITVRTGTRCTFHSIYIGSDWYWVSELL